jgi:hypothetical protein
MSVAELKDLCTNNHVTIPADVADEHLLDWLLSEFGV